MNPYTAEPEITGRSYLERLLDAFGGSIEGWEWTGQIIEQDPKSSTAIPCACGHQRLRFLFPWRRSRIVKYALAGAVFDGLAIVRGPLLPGEKIIYTGSVCVETVPGITPELMASFAGEIKAARKREKEAKSAALAHQISQGYDALEADVDRVAKVFDDMRNRFGNLPDGFGGRNARLILLGEKLAGAKKLKSTRGRKARLCQLREAFEKDFRSETNILMR